MLKNKIKSIAIALTVALGISVGASVPAFASETSKATTTEPTTVTLDLGQLGTTTPYSEDMIRESKGLKKTAVVYALKYGGKALAKIAAEIGDKKIAAMLLENSYEIGAFLEGISNGVEARLIDFMIFNLGLPQSAARIIAGVISALVL